MIGRTYLESAFGPDFKRLPPSPVVLLERWGYVDNTGNHRPTSGRVPRNVMIRRADGTVVIRPFRGLRRI